MKIGRVFLGLFTWNHPKGKMESRAKLKRGKVKEGKYGRGKEDIEKKRIFLFFRLAGVFFIFKHRAKMYCFRNPYVLFCCFNKPPYKAGQVIPAPYPLSIMGTRVNLMIYLKSQFMKAPIH